MRDENFHKEIIAWYQENRRRLPWRNTNDPYKIWLSEVILQQTRVDQGLPYYLKFIESFPTIQKLATAPEDIVLRHWQGLGYYSRARNLHRCAKKVVETFDGHFPHDFHQLQTLPGIGSYTAAAIASIAFNEVVPVIDGNVFRVMARIFGIDADISVPATKQLFFERAQQLISKAHPGDYNQAMMEFGALHCTPVNPKCDTCPFRKGCIAFNKEMIADLPVKTKKVKTRTRHIHYFIVESGGKIAMKKRTGRDIWNGLYDFHLVEAKSEKDLSEMVSQDQILKLLAAKKLDSLRSGQRHILTHQILHLQFSKIKITQKILTKIQRHMGDLRFYSMKEIKQLPKPKPITTLLDEIAF